MYGISKKLAISSLSIMESQILNDGEKSTEVKSTIVSKSCKSLFFENKNLSHEVHKKKTAKQVKMRKYINLNYYVKIVK